MKEGTAFSSRFAYHWRELLSERLEGTCYFSLWVPRMQLSLPVPLVVYIGGLLTYEEYQERRKHYPQPYEDLLAELLRKGDLSPLAFLAIPGPFERSDVPFLWRYAEFVWQEVIPKVEAEFPVGGEAALRAAIGVSAGGTVALKMALDTGQFALAAAHSSPALTNLIGDVHAGKGKQIVAIVDWADHDLMNVQLEAFPFCEAARGHMKALLGGEYPGEHTWASYGSRVKLSLRKALELAWQHRSCMRHR